MFIESCDISPPYTFIDKIVSLTPGKSCTGFKYWTSTEMSNLFSPIALKKAGGETRAVVPQSLQIETFAQFLITAICAEVKIKYSDTRLFECSAEFFNPCFIGSLFEVFTELTTKRQGIFIGICKGYVEDELICKAKLKILVPKIWNEYI